MYVSVVDNIYTTAPLEVDILMNKRDLFVRTYLPYSDQKKIVYSLKYQLPSDCDLDPEAYKILVARLHMSRLFWLQK